MSIQTIHEPLKIFKFLYLIKKHIVILIIALYTRVDIILDSLVVQHIEIVLIIILIKINCDDVFFLDIALKKIVSEYVT